MAEGQRSEPRCTLDVGACSLLCPPLRSPSQNQQLNGSDCVTLALTCHHFQPCTKEKGLLVKQPPPTPTCLEIISAQGFLGEFPKDDGGPQLPTPMQWPEVIDRPTATTTTLVCPQSLSTQCPRETTSLSLLAGTAASGSLCRPISRSRHHGNGSRRTGCLASPRPPSPRPLPWGGVQKGGSRGSGEKSPPQPPFPPQKAREPMQNLQGALHFWVWGTPASSLRAHRLPPAPFFSSRQVCGSPAACPPFHALTVEGGAPPPPRTWPPSLSPTWMYAIFARATHSGPGIAPPQPLCPRQQERGERAKGERKKRQPGGPRRDWRG